jgi:hypothetical protein
MTIENTGGESSPAPVFDLDELPSGWSVSSWSNADATYRSSTNEWLWTEIEGGEQEQLTVTLQASESASGFSVSGDLTDGYDNTANGEGEIIIGSAPTPTPTPTQGGGGGGGGGSGDGGVGGIDDSTDSPTPSENANYPGTNITDSSPGRAGTTVTFNNLTVESVTFGGDFSGTISVNSTSLSQSENQTLEEAAISEPNSSADVISAVNIEPSISGANTTNATVVLTVAQSQLTDLSSTQIVHQTPSSVEQLNTTVTETINGTVHLQGQTDSFSVFAVVQVTDSNSTMTNDTDRPAQTDTTTGGSGPGFGITAGVIGTILCMLLTHRRHS